MQEVDDDDSKHSLCLISILVTFGIIYFLSLRLLFDSRDTSYILLLPASLAYDFLKSVWYPVY